MAAYIARRLLSLIPVLFVVGAVVFALIHLTPGDPAAVIAGPGATPDQILTLRRELGLDAPLAVQFARWFAGALTGNFGNSLYFNEPVVTTLLTHAAPTVSLTGLAFAFALVIAVPTGVFAAVQRDSVLDRAFVSVSLLGISIPNFWLALILIMVFAVRVQWFPVAGYVPPDQGWWPWLRALILPAFVLAAQQAGIIARILRDGMLDVLAAPYIQTARGKGLTERRVILRHALPNALIPTATVIGTSLAALLGGAVVTETVFTIPGIGELVVDSIGRRDYPVVQGVVLLVAIVYVVVNLIVDVSYTVLDPRIRYD
jgi:peptide/nickel transport system permease protein